MPNYFNGQNSILAIDNVDGFNEMALKIFQFQFENNTIYKSYVENIGKNPTAVNTVDDIPFLPISFFKSHRVLSRELPAQKIFSSSGTGNQGNSKHYVADLCVYEQGLLKGFQMFYGNIADYVILALLPSYLERGGSSLVYMADKLIKLSGKTESGFYLDEYESLNTTLGRLKTEGKKVILLGVGYALLDMAEKFDVDFQELIIMETGGMKGRRREMLKEELHKVLCDGFGVEKIHSEYGMTELLSQAYSKGNGIFNCPPWMKIKIRDINDPFAFVDENKSGGINVIDLANVYSCSFIETQDLGKAYADGSFQVLGRFDNSDIRGCNLLIG
ncbi:MAG: acyl transferase [Chlorobi bacterium]|nr:acyl transferase [Chlorobiota bacterium]